MNLKVNIPIFFKFIRKHVGLKQLNLKKDHFSDD